MALSLISSSSSSSSNNNNNEASVFASHIASTTVFATSLGKFINGPSIDLFGSRRILLLYVKCLSFSLLMLSFARNESECIGWCAAVEFFSSVLWPCILVILSSHYGGNKDGDGMEVLEIGGGGGDGGSVVTTTTFDAAEAAAEEEYEGGVYVCSLAGRFGSLASVILSSWMLRSSSSSNDEENDENEDNNNKWRSVARCGALIGLLSCILIHTFVTDSPTKIHDPQNPIRIPSTLSSFRSSFKVQIIYVIITTTIFTSVVPSLKSVLSSSIFWIVAAAHSGSTMITSSNKILGTYYRDTSSPNGTITENQAGGFTIFLSLGMVFGLAIHGRIFASLSFYARERKKLIMKLYICTVAMCYALSILAIPFVRNVMIRSSSIILMLQIMATFGLGVGIAVPLYHIPAIVGQTSFTAGNRGLYASYTDGVSYGVASIVWRVVGGAVEEGNGTGSGWAYGWADVALLVILCGVIMVEFMEHYFVRGWKGGFNGSATDADVTRRSKKDDGVSGNRGVVDGNSGVGNLLSSSATSSKNSYKRSDPFQRCVGDCGGKSLLGLKPTSPLALFKSKSKRIESIMEMEEEEDNDDEGGEDISFLGVEDEIIFQRNLDDDVESRMVEALQKKSDAESSLLVPTTTSKASNGKESSLVAINLKERMEALLERKENRICVDCTNRYPRWASILVPISDRQNSNGSVNQQQLGCFCCTDCAASHRRLGTHILFVRSIDHDTFKEQEVRALEQGGGNIGINRIYEAKLKDKSIKPQHSAHHNWTRESFTTIKYQRRKWADFSMVDFRTNTSTTVVKHGEMVMNGMKAFLDDELSNSSSSSSCSAGTTGLIELVKSPALKGKYDENDETGKKRQSNEKVQKSAHTSLVPGYDSDSGSDDDFMISNDGQQRDVVFL